MIYNYFKTAFRNFSKNRLSFALNVLGVSLALFSSITILEFIAFEKSYDTYNTNAQRIYRITLDRYKENKLLEKSALGPAALPIHIKDTFPWVDSYVRMTRVGETEVRIDKTSFIEKEFFFADSTFFRVFSLGLTKGNISDALTRPNSIALSASMALKFFGDKDPIGQLIELNSETAQGSFLITGVYNDTPENSHMKPDALISLNTVAQMLGDLNENWDFNFFYNYVLVNSEVSSSEVSKQMLSIFETDINQRDFLHSSNQKIVPVVQNITDIHLNSTNVNEMGEGGSKSILTFLYAVVVLIMVIAWVNYVNLTTSQVFQRFKEVGVRKVLGASQIQLVAQFLIETILTNLIALILALVLASTTSSFFGELTGKPFSLHHLLENSWILISFFLVFAAGVLISGLYAAFFLSVVKPIAILKETFVKGKEGAMVRRGLVGLQFSVAIVIIFASFISFKQLAFMMSDNLGIDIDNVMLVNIPTGGGQFNSTDVGLFINEVKADSRISNASLSTSIPGTQIHWKSYSIKVKDKPELYTMNVLGVHASYFSLFQNKFLAGRDFRPGDPSNNGLAIINLETIKLLGFEKPEDAINKEIEDPKARNPEFWNLRIIGVVDNFHYNSMKSHYEPMLFRHHEGAEGYLILKISGADPANILPFVKDKFKNAFPSTAFEHRLLQDVYFENYKQEQSYNKIVFAFAVLAGFITCLGIFGLSAFTMQTNLKEISIRKVLGAANYDLFYVLTNEMVKIILVSSVVALPTSFVIVNRWLESFPFRLSFEWWFFLIPVAIILVISILTMAYHLLKAIKMSPVKALTRQ
jgi:putative ABC transport system permease protein